MTKWFAKSKEGLAKQIKRMKKGDVIYFVGDRITKENSDAIQGKLTNEERFWILKQIENYLVSFRNDDKKGLVFKGSFSKDLPEEEREIMKGIVRKI